jgi:hypothetical protein
LRTDSSFFSSNHSLIWAEETCLQHTAAPNIYYSSEKGSEAELRVFSCPQCSSLQKIQSSAGARWRRWYICSWTWHFKPILW